MTDKTPKLLVLFSRPISAGINPASVESITHSNSGKTQIIFKDGSHIWVEETVEKTTQWILEGLTP